MLQNLFAGLQGLVDHIMVGHFVGFQANAAIGVSWQIFVVVVIFISSLFSGMAVLGARFAGAGQQEKVNRVVYQVFLTSTFISLAVFAPLGYFLAPDLLDLVHAAPEVQEEALPYIRILLVFSLGTMHFFMFGGALRAAGDARTPMRLGIMLTVLNLALNVVLIRGLGPIPAFGTRGAAMGTVIASGLVALRAFYLVFNGSLVVRFTGFKSWMPDWKIISQVFRFGLPTGIPRHRDERRRHLDDEVRGLPRSERRGPGGVRRRLHPVVFPHHLDVDRAACRRGDGGGAESRRQPARASGERSTLFGSSGAIDRRADGGALLGGASDPVGHFRDGRPHRARPGSGAVDLPEPLRGLSDHRVELHRWAPKVPGIPGVRSTSRCFLK